jgi:pentatricopeptide repeat protein
VSTAALAIARHFVAFLKRLAGYLAARLAWQASRATIDHAFRRSGVRLTAPLDVAVEIGTVPDMSGSSFYVSKSSGGGYWVTDDAAAFYSGQAAGALASGVGTILASGFGAAIAFQKDWADRRRMHEFEQAVEELERVASSADWRQTYLLSTEFVRRHAAEPFGYAMRAEASCNLGRPDEALQIINEMETRGLAAGDSLAALRLVAHLAREDVRSALREAQGLADSPDKAARRFGLIARSRVLLWLGDLDQSLRDADAAAAEEPSEVSYGVRGDVHWARGELDKAAADYSFALRLSPDREVHEKRAAVYEALGQANEAAADREAVRRSAPPPPKVRTQATILIRRVRQTQGGGGRYTVWFDGDQSGSLAGGETLSLEVSPGRHSGYVSWGPVKSDPVTFQAAGGQDVLLECGEVKGSFGLGKFVLREPTTADKPFKN